ncbi:MAG TPA: Ig-like domain repeat protein, partial [Thermomicrobiaceae bacterium]|nr:Ig-like domain repeat protein [Thermomicrobiaceae bacterium]
MGVTIRRPRRATRPLSLVLAILALLVSLVAMLATAAPGRAGSPYTVGDVFAGVGGGNIKEFSPTGTLIQTLSAPAGTEDSGMVFDLAGNLYATQFQAERVVKFDNAGNLLGTFGSGYNSHPESIVRDFAGNFYVGQPDGSHQVLKFDAAGNPLGSFSPAVENRGTDWIDLRADQCTLFYTSEGSLIKRFDVCSNTQLANFASIPGTDPGNQIVAYALRILPNQDVLVAASNQVVLFDPSGAVVRQYPASTFVGASLSGTNPLFALNLDADLTSFWTAALGSGDVYRVNIASGALITHFNAGALNPSLAGLAVFGEVTAAQPKLQLTPTSDTKPVGASETLTASLINVINPLNTPITFTVTGANPQTATVAADASGTATFTYTGANAGTDTVVASATTAAPAEPAGASLTSNASTIIWTQAPTTLTYDGATTSDYHDPATVSATLTSQVTNAPIPGETVVFTLNGAETCSGVTDASGKASCSITPQEAANTYPPVAGFAGSANYQASSTTVNFVVTLEETTLTITSSNTLASGSPVSAQLL